MKIMESEVKQKKYYKKFTVQAKIIVENIESSF